MEEEQIKKFKEFNTELRTKGLVISRVPDKTKEEFTSFANGEYSGDYGLLLKVIWDQFKEYQFMKSLYGTMNTKLDQVIEILSPQEEVTEKDIKKIRLLSGKEFNIPIKSQEEVK